MKKYINNERGLTLIELLAVLVIGSIILILLSNIHIFGHKQNKEQSQKAASSYDVSYAAKVITKEIRKAETVKVKDNILILNLNKPNQIIFKESNGAILMNGSPVVKEVSEFIVHPKGSIVDHKNILVLTIKGKYLEEKRTVEEITTEIFIRGENLNE